MDELGDITLEDVKDWFVKNRIYESEEVQNRLAETVLDGATSKKLAAIEAAHARLRGGPFPEMRERPFVAS